MNNGIIPTIKRFLYEAKNDHIGAYAAQAAYFITLSFIPFIMLLLSAIKYTPITEENIISLTLKVLPSTIEPLAVSILEEIYEKSVAIIPIAAITASLSSEKGVMSITSGLNSVYGVAETRNYIIVRLRSLFYTVIFMVSILMSLIILVFGKSLEQLLEKKIPVIGRISEFIMNIRILGITVVMVILIGFFVFLYRFLPNRKEKLIDQLPGAVFTAATWAVFSFFFAVYVDRSSRFSYMYGSLTMVIMMMLWLYFCMYLMLIGAEINAFLKDEMIRWYRFKKK